MSKTPGTENVADSTGAHAGPAKGEVDPFAATPDPPYYAVIFTRVRTAIDDGYEAEAEKMWRLAREQPGFLGLESVASDDRTGITVSYWSSPEAIAAWKQNVEHLMAQKKGREAWYSRYELRVARVERAYGFRR
jgi:heme-degrading monooxygenase HmoA